MASAKSRPVRLPKAKHERPADLAGLPDPHPESYTPHEIRTAGRWLILSDIHAPYHDRATIEAAVREARRRGVVGVLLNGDTLDYHELSSHDHDPTAARYTHEIKIGRQLLSWLRGQFRRAEIVYKEGNHEERLPRFLFKHAPSLFDIPGLHTPGLLEFDRHGVQWVGDRRVIGLGKLNVIHGHELQGGAASPVNPARGLYLKARSVAMCGHHHQTSEHHARNIRGKAEAAWSLGCCCFLSPRYMRINNWNHGFAFVELAKDGEFAVENKRVRNGRIE